MEKIRLTIKDGRVAGFADDIAQAGIKLEGATKTRVSRILPRNWLLRLMFSFIRSFVKDNSKIAEWTRKWSCEWLVFIDDKQYGPFTDRAKAIECEKEELYKSGKLTEFVNSV